MASIAFDEVSKVFPDGTKAVDGLSLEIEDGEFTILVGPSGSGKSTALRMVAGLEEASSGDISIGSRVVNDVAPRDRDIAMVFQSYALYPHMSVAQNMGFALKLQKVGSDSIRARVGRAASRLGISELQERRPRALSGGQRQRVALGRAIVRSPEAFLMDEPLSNLDAKLRVEMRAYIARLHQELNTTTLYVTHDQTEAMTMGDRVAVMRDGKLEQVDTPQRLYEQPENLFVAGFIGSPAMNLVRGVGRRRRHRARRSAPAVSAPHDPPRRCHRRHPARGARARRRRLLPRAARGPFGDARNRTSSCTSKPRPRRSSPATCSTPETTSSRTLPGSSRASRRTCAQAPANASGYASTCPACTSSTPPQRPWSGAKLPAARWDSRAVKGDGL